MKLTTTTHYLYQRHQSSRCLVAKRGKVQLMTVDQNTTVTSDETTRITGKWWSNPQTWARENNRLHWSLLLATDHPYSSLRWNHTLFQSRKRAINIKCQTMLTYRIHSTSIMLRKLHSLESGWSKLVLLDIFIYQQEQGRSFYYIHNREPR